ncbi:MAG: HNH endonuclease [Anaerolineae bacterium]|nr:HNH endonuclease [Anaerolineae bacterium]
MRGKETSAPFHKIAYSTAHHVMHWVDGGKTSLDNTLLLCDRHHRLLHEGGYRIRTDHRGELFFQTARGKVVG